VSNAIQNFMGGSFLSVLIRLILLSLLAGAIMAWLDISPEQLLSRLHHMLSNLWSMGFGAVREILRYILAGAIVVVPVWFILRILNLRR
jgi:hypothetical protein